MARQLKYSPNYIVKPAVLEKGRYRGVAGNPRQRWAFWRRPSYRGWTCFWVLIPSRQRPMSCILEQLQTPWGADLQAEDEIAGVARNRGNVRGRPGADDNEWPGDCVKGEAIGLAAITELPS